MSFGADVTHGVQEIQRGDDIVRLHEDSVMNVHHGVRRGGALAQVRDGIRLELLENLLNDVVLAKIRLPKT